MSFSEVKTLFHEFGHGLQGMLTTIDYSDAAGINGIEWDAVEVASQFMENWCYHKQTLIGMTAHIDTGETLPDALFDKICAARTFRAGSMFMRQLEFGMTDMALHTEFDPNGEASVFDVHQQIARDLNPLPPLPESRFLCSFSHIFAGGYAAGYYSYKWAEVLSADAFAAFEEVGLDNEAAIAALGRRYRDTILACGGGRDPMKVFQDFRGRAEHRCVAAA
jgi:oligopeptidase A